MTSFPFSHRCSPWVSVWVASRAWQHIREFILPSSEPQEAAQNFHRIPTVFQPPKLFCCFTFSKTWGLLCSTKPGEIAEGGNSVRVQTWRNFAPSAEAQLVSMRTIPEAAECWEKEQLGLRNALLPAHTRGTVAVCTQLPLAPWQHLLRAFETAPNRICMELQFYSKLICFFKRYMEIIDCV